MARVGERRGTDGHPGKKPGEVKMIKRGETVEAHQVRSLGFDYVSRSPTDADEVGQYVV